jgi:tripartite-type tricarboxylate transporter receptor subunit TctC
MIEPTRRQFVAAAAATSIIGPAHAQSGRTVRLLVGFPAGGTIDTTARILAETMGPDLGATVIVENRVGAGGQIAATAVKQAAADGSTLLLAPDHTMVIVPLTVRAPGFDPLADFAPIGSVASYLGAFAVAPQTNITTLAAYLAAAKGNPALATIGVPAAGSIPAFFVGALANSVGAGFTSVPYRGAAPLVQDLTGGHVPAALNALGDMITQHRAGSLRLLALMDRERSPLVPEVPIFRELGHDITWCYWLGLFAPAGTSEPLVTRLNASLNRALALPTTRARLEPLFFDATPGPAGDLTQLIRAGRDTWAPQIAASGWVMQ